MYFIFINYLVIYILKCIHNVDKMSEIHKICSMFGDISSVIVIVLFICMLYIIYRISYNLYQLSNTESFNSNLFKWNSCYTSNQNKLIQTFNKYGCVIIPNTISEKECDELLEIISKEERNKKNETSEINSNYKRKDMILNLNETKSYIKKIYTNLKHFCDIIVPSAKIVENSSLISYPGCYPQVWHTDTNFKSKKEANLVSFGIALSDINEHMGPLEVYLESNKLYESNTEEIVSRHSIKEDLLDGEYDDGNKYQMIEKICKVSKFKKGKCICKKGSLVIWSSKVVHRGGKNNDKKRPVFYFSLQGSGTKPVGATYSLKKKDNMKCVKNI